MKTLLTITVLVSSVLSIFSSTLRLYEVPVLKQTVSVLKKGMGAVENKSQNDAKRVYISYDASNMQEEKSVPLLREAGKMESIPKDTKENYISVFGVKVPSKNT